MKKFKFLFIATVLICVLTTSTLLYACENDTPDDTTKLVSLVGQSYEDVGVSIYNGNSLTLKNSDYSAIINSVEELDAFCNESTSPIFDKEDKPNKGQNQKFINVLRGSDQKFFKNKSLVVLFRTRGSSAYLYDFNDYNIEGADLNITLSMAIPKESADSDCVMTTFVYVFVFNKSKVNGVTQVNVKEIHECVPHKGVTAYTA